MVMMMDGWMDNDDDNDRWMNDRDDDGWVNDNDDTDDGWMDE